MKQAFNSHQELCEFFYLWNSENDIPQRHEGRHKNRQLLSEVQHLEGYLRTLSHFKKLAFPFEVEKSESPDFLIKEGNHMIGLEVTQATDPNFQAWLSKISGKQGAHMYNREAHSGGSEIMACNCVLEKINDKAHLLQGYYNNHPIHHCDLLLNISLDCFVVGEVLFGMLQEKLKQFTFGFRLLSIIADDKLLFAVNTPQAQLLQIPSVEG